MTLQGCGKRTAAMRTGQSDGGGVPRVQPEVRLLQAVKIPASHRKLVRASINGSVGGWNATSDTW